MSFKGLPAYLSDLVADSITGATITGGIIQTALAGTRWVLSSPANVNTLLGYSGNAHEFAPARIVAGVNTDAGVTNELSLDLFSPVNNQTNRSATLQLNSADGGTSSFLNADTTSLTGGVEQFSAGVGYYVARLLMFANGGDPTSGVVNLTATGASGAMTLTAAAINLAGLVKPSQLQMAGATINAIDFGGNAAATTGSAGGLVVNHNLGVIPVAILAIPFTSSNSMIVHVGAKTTTNFTLQFSNSTTGAALATTAVGFFWVAIA